MDGTFFWDTDIGQLDVDKNSTYIITRLLNFSDQHKTWMSILAILKQLNAIAEGVLN